MTRCSKRDQLDIPAELSDETTAAVLDLLYEAVRVFESRYFVQLRRYHDAVCADRMQVKDTQRPAADPARPQTEPPF